MDEYLTRQSLLLRAKNLQDERAWKEIVDIYRHYIFVVIMSKGLSSSQADDVQQLVLLELWQNLHKYDSEKSKFRHWVAMISHHKTIDYIRKESNHLKKINNQEIAEQVEKSEIEALAEKEWKFFIANMAMKNLQNKIKPIAMQCFQLHAQGVSVKDISEQLDLKLVTTYKNISRVKVKVYQEIQRLQAELDI